MAVKRRGYRDFVLDARVAQGALRSSTAAQYKRDIRNHLLPEFGPYRVDDIDVERIERYRDKLTAGGLSNDTVRRIVTTLGYTLKLARKWRLIAHNPVSDADKSSTRRRTPSLPSLRRRSPRSRQTPRMCSLKLPAPPCWTGSPRAKACSSVGLILGGLLTQYSPGRGSAGWGSARTLGFFTTAATLLTTFVAIELRAKAPLVRLSIFRIRSLLTANVAMLLAMSGMFAMFFFNTLYLQRILGYGPADRRARLPAVHRRGSCSRPRSPHSSHRDSASGRSPPSASCSLPPGSSS